MRAAAAELPAVGLEDALAICLVLLDADPGAYEPAAVRWIGRVLLERPGLTLAAAEAPEILSSDKWELRRLARLRPDS